jgi:hypothetical protein
MQGAQTMRSVVAFLDKKKYNYPNERALLESVA